MSLRRVSTRPAADFNADEQDSVKPTHTYKQSRCHVAGGTHLAASSWTLQPYSACSDLIRLDLSGTSIPLSLHVSARRLCASTTRISESILQQLSALATLVQVQETDRLNAHPESHITDLLAEPAFHTDHADYCLQEQARLSTCRLQSSLVRLLLHLARLDAAPETHDIGHGCVTSYHASHSCRLCVPSVQDGPKAITLEPLSLLRPPNVI